ncbi:hypothetical protein GCM10008107_18570 [Psychrosphaera saromensis]|nr:GreA/GreB family elongation factor [Psychrosphaera saromensis]GHB69532.1 hypothetical protein GCM10008107_18570 [Psychrosphaera saromensis]GLQ13042.1 hypothetical protein GCM10007917_04970 [Psychrosphaera saromensis]
MNPITLCSLLDRLEFSNSQVSRLENRTRVGSTVGLKNLSTKEQFDLHIVEGEKNIPLIETVSYTSVLGCELLGLRFGEVAKIKTSAGVAKWQVISINNSH